MTIDLESEYRTLQLNPIHLLQLKKTGVEVKFFKTKEEQVGIRGVNPLEKLFASGVLTHQEYAAGIYYQKKFLISTKSNFAQLIWDRHTGASSGDNNQLFDPQQEKIEAGRYIFAAKAAVAIQNSETVFQNKKFQIINLQLLDILRYVFEQEIAIWNIEKPLGLTRRTVNKRIKKICNILLDLKKPSKL